MPKTLRGKVVVITGASAGIGRAAALFFAAEGANVVVAARRRDRLENLKARIEESGAKCLAVTTDVSIREQVQRLLDATLEHFGRVDVWINNAGYGLVGSVEQTTPEEMEQLWSTNYMGVFHGCQVALQQMRRQGSGHIMNVSSMVARFPLPLHAAYTATKYAMNGLSDALAIELSGTGIHVSTIMPGVTETEFGAAVVKKIPDVAATYGPAASAEKVARQIVKCAKHPRDKVMFVPLPPLALAFFDLFPSLWDIIARKYVAVRTGGRGVPVSELDDLAADPARSLGVVE